MAIDAQNFTSDVVRFAYRAVPALVSLEPRTGSLAGGTNFTLRGNALRGGSGTVSLQGASRMVKTCAFFASLDAPMCFDYGVRAGRNWEFPVPNASVPRAAADATFEC